MSDPFNLQMKVDEAKDLVIQRVLEFTVEDHKSSYDFNAEYWPAWVRIDEALDQYVKAANAKEEYSKTFDNVIPFPNVMEE